MSFGAVTLQFVYNLSMLWVLGVLMCAVSVGFAQTPVDFTRDIRPIFEKKCQGCHGAQQQMAGLRLDDGQAALKGSYGGPVITPGKSAESKLILRVSSDKKGFQMPPGGERLSAAELGRLRSWIDQGAKTPAAQAETRRRSTDWSFQPIRRPASPAVQNRSWIRNPIDAFVLSKLESGSIEPSVEASRSTLIRRVSLDLTGLPPSPAEIRDFLADNRPDAYERLVDRLLASPHYGEKWARHWLDLAHYADSDGYEKDRARPWAWRYRQWVIDALNRDMPFDQFTIEQLAGDTLPNATVEQKVATGFLRNTQTNREGGTDRAEVRFEQVTNRTNTIGTVWLGLTVGCAQCHNHKYDPISQKEYYQLSAFVHRAEEEDIDAPLPGEMGPYLHALPEYRSKRKALLDEYKIPEMQAQWEAKMRAAIASPGKDLEWDFQVTAMMTMFDHTVKVLTTDPAKRKPADQQRLTNWFVGNTGHEFGRDKEVTAKIKELREKLSKLDSEFPALTQAPVMIEDPTQPPAYIAVKGDFREKGIPVEPGALEVLPPIRVDPSNPRLSLARWLVAPENPLTSRVTVNRIWQELFGRGLVRTSEDFGKQGDKPTNPELLDWLASEFIERGWSMKQLQRVILTSATYRQSSKVRPELSEKDPENTLLARQSRLRLSAELIRDSALAASGLLYPAIGGRSIRPPQPAGIAELGYANSQKWVETKGKERYRRGLYVHFQRTTPYPQLMNFDEPDSTVTCSRRRTSNTSLQALNLLNDPVFFEAAQALAERTQREAPGGINEKLEYAFEVCVGRKPAAREREKLAKYVEQQGGDLVGLSRVLLNLDEFITRE